MVGVEFVIKKEWGDNKAELVNGIEKDIPVDCLVKSGNKKIVLEMARQNKVILKSVIKKNDVVEEKINPELIAGIKIIIDNERQLDFSLKNKLDKIF